MRQNPTPSSCIRGTSRNQALGVLIFALTRSSNSSLLSFEFGWRFLWVDVSMLNSVREFQSSRDFDENNPHLRPKISNFGCNWPWTKWESHLILANLCLKIKQWGWSTHSCQPSPQLLPSPGLWIWVVSRARLSTVRYSLPPVGSASFGNISCPHIDHAATAVTSPVKASRFSYRWTIEIDSMIHTKKRVLVWHQ